MPVSRLCTYNYFAGVNNSGFLIRDPKFEFRNFLVKTIITVLSVVLSTYGVVQALALLFSSLIFTYNVLYHFPFYTKGVNYCRVGLFASLVWLGLCATVLTLVAGENAGLQHNVTIVTLAGLVPSGFIGALFAYLRGKNLGNYDTCLGWLLRASDAKIVDENSISSITGKNDFKKRTKLMKAGSGQSFIAIRAVGVVNGLKFPEVTRRELMEANPGDLVVHRTFRSPADVERSTRFVKKNPSDPSRVFLGNLIYQEGLRQFPNNAFLHLAYCNYLLSYSKQREEAYSHLDKARQLQPRYRLFDALFCRPYNANISGSLIDSLFSCTTGIVFMKCKPMIQEPPQWILLHMLIFATVMVQQYQIIFQYLRYHINCAEN